MEPMMTWPETVEALARKALLLSHGSKGSTITEEQCETSYARASLVVVPFAVLWIPIVNRHFTVR